MSCGAISEFAPSGELIREFTGAGVPPPYEPAAVAVDPSNGDVLIVSNNVGDEFQPSFVDEFTHSGKFIGQITGTTAGPFPDFSLHGGIAVNSQGYIYLGYNATTRDVDIFNPNVPLPTVTYKPVADPTPTSGALTALADPAAGGKVIECRFEYGLKIEQYGLGSKPCLNAEGHEVGTAEHPIETPTEVHAEISSLTTETAYHYRLLLANGKEAVDVREAPDQIYTPHHVHGLLTEPATEVKATTAILNASFYGNGEETHYYFEWGLTTKYGNVEPALPGTAVSPAPGSPESISVPLRGLEPNTPYHYRIVAQNGEGQSYGEDELLTTTPSKPLVEESVLHVHSDSAILRARINAGGGDAHYHFEWGTGVCSETPDPCTATPVPDADLGFGQSFKGVEAQLGELQPDTLYHYRVIAANEIGTTEGEEKTFTTFAYIPKIEDPCPNAHSRQQTGAALLLDCRAYELVSAPDTGGFDVESDLIEGQTPYPGYPGAEGRLLYGVHDGGIPGLGHPTDRGLDPYLATRTESGWMSEYVGIPADGTPSTAPFSSTLLEADPSLDAFAFGGPEICSPCFHSPSTESGEPLRLPGGELIQGMAGQISQPAAKPAGYIATPFSPDGTHFVFGSKSKFEPDGNEGEISIYDRNLKTGEIHVVSKTPTEQTMKEEGKEIGELAISNEGPHILIGHLVEEKEGAKYWHLYMNVGDESKTIDLTPGITKGVLFDGMTEDGKKVFFSSVEHLTGEDTSHTGADIYMWEEGHPLSMISAGTEANASSCNPAADTANEHWNTTGSQANCGDVAVGGGAGVASAHGTLYFLSPSLLDGTEEPADGVKGAPNLYLARPGHAPKFIVTLESSANAPLPPTEHPLRRSFGSFGSGPGNSHVLAGIAIDQSSGDAYALEDINAGAILQKFDSSGNLVASFGAAGHVTGAACPDGLPFYGGNDLPGGIAVDNDPASPSYRDVYVPDAFNSYIDKLEPDGKCVASIKFPEEKVTAVAVNPANGDLYAAGFTGHEGAVGLLSAYTPKGKPAPIFPNPAFGQPGEPELIPSFETITIPNSLAVDSHGTVYVANADATDGFKGEAVAYDSSGALIGPLATGEDTGVAVDTAGTAATNPDFDHVYVHEGTQLTEFAPPAAGHLGAAIGGPIGAGLLFGGGEPSSGVAVDESRLLAGSMLKTTILEFGPRISPFDPAVDNPLVLDSVTEPEARRTVGFQITPSGDDAVFTSTLPLTGFQSSGHREVFRYDAPTETLACVSCNQSGEPVSGDATLAADGQSLTNDGRVFFNSSEALVDRDLNEQEDVYEWAPQGTGTCTPENPSFSKVTNTCLDLLSTGTSPSASSLLGVSANSTDAFFFTREALAHGDENGARVRIYDARLNGGFPFIPNPVPCKASDECHGAGSPQPQPPNIQSVGSSPGGNESPTAEGKCKKGFVRKHGHCVHEPKPRTHKHHKRTHHKRGGKK